jgi:hypothetical protein
MLMFCPCRLGINIDILAKVSVARLVVSSEPVEACFNEQIKGTVLGGCRDRRTECEASDCGGKCGTIIFKIGCSGAHLSAQVSGAIARW